MKFKFLLLLITFSSFQLFGQCDRERDSLALANLYLSTNGPDWNKDWDLSLPMTEWPGIALTSEGCVRSISLGFTGIEGPLPAGLSVLSELETMWLSANSLSGEISSSYGDLKKLKKLNLGFNELSGAIPEELGMMTNLEELYLSSNDLSGSFPIGLTQLSNLKIMGLSFNDLAGNVPSEIGSMSQLEELNLAANDFTGTIPEALMNLSNLSSLQLYGNDMSGELPEDIGNLSNLEHFSISANSFSGEIPESFGQLKKLRDFSLTNNNFSGEIPDVFYGFDDLWGFEIPVNSFTGSIPPSVANLPNLQTLSLHTNQLSGSIPEALGDLEKLDVVRLQGNKFSGCIPSSFSNLCEYEVKLEDNVGLTWSGDFEKFCAGEEQVGSPCIDGFGNAAFINEDCGCGELVSAKNISQNSAYLLSPNPAVSTLNIEGDFSDLNTVQVYNNNGVLVKNVNPRTSEIDVSDFNPGIYFLRINTKSQNQVIRFVKM